MTSSHYLIIAATFIALILFTKPGGPSVWMQSLKDNRTLAFILIIAMISTFLGGSREAGADTSAVDSVRLARMIVLILLFFWSINAIMKSPKILRMAGPGSKFILAYGVFAMFSSTYSVDTLLTLWKAFEVVTLVLVIIAVAKNIESLNDTENMVHLLLLILLFLSISVVAGVLIAPELANKVLWEEGNAQDKMFQKTAAITIIRGVMPELNPSAAGGIAGLVAISALVAVFNEQGKRKIGYIAIMAICCTTIFLVHSRTGIFALTAAVIVILVLKRYTLYAVILAVPASGVLAFTALSDTIKAYIYRGQTEAQFSSMSGRTEFWELVLGRFMESPIFGHGYYASHRVLFNVSGVDNTYLSVLLGVGAVGLTFFLLSLGFGAYNLLRTRPKSNSSIQYETIWLQLTGMSTIIFIRSLTGTSFETFYHLLFIYMVLQICIYSLVRVPDSSEKSGDDSEEPEENKEPMRFIPKRSLNVNDIK